MADSSPSVITHIHGDHPYARGGIREDDWMQHWHDCLECQSKDHRVQNYPINADILNQKGAIHQEFTICYKSPAQYRHIWGRNMRLMCSWPVQVARDPLNTSEWIRSDPKANQAGCWRLFLNLSLPRGQSVNDMQHEAKTISQYTTVDKVNSCLLQAGRGAKMLAKVNIKNVYQDNQHLVRISGGGR